MTRTFQVGWKSISQCLEEGMCNVGLRDNEETRGQETRVPEVICENKTKELVWS